MRSESESESGSESASAAHGGLAARSGHARFGGFSFVELLVVTVLAASLAVAAAPLFLRWHARDRVDGAARALLAGLTFARGEAIARGARVTVCPADGGRCLPSRAACTPNALGWSCGWAIIADDGRGARVLRVYRSTPGVLIAAASGRVAFTPPAGQVIGGFRKFAFAAAGFAEREQSDALRRCIRIAAGGRARLDRGACDARPRA